MMIAEENQQDTQRPTEEPIDVLVNLAQDGEIDPWDIDIVRVTDKFLDRIDDVDLGRSGRGILYASILLRMKSDYLVEADENDEDESMEWDAPREEDWELHDDPISDLEREHDRRMKRRRVRDRSRPETLDELIRELRRRERDSWWKDAREYRTDESPESPMSPAGGVMPEPTVEDATSTAHKDDIEDYIDEIRERVEEEFSHRDELLFRELIERGDSKNRAVVKFICLLFLSSRDKLRLEQDDLYGDLWVMKP